jgi:hypothetical protein
MIFCERTLTLRDKACERLPEKHRIDTVSRESLIVISLRLFIDERIDCERGTRGEPRELLGKKRLVEMSSAVIWSSSKICRFIPLKMQFLPISKLRLFIGVRKILVFDKSFWVS